MFQLLLLRPFSIAKSNKGVDSGIRLLFFDFALQFHLEVTPAVIKTWAKAYAVEIDEFSGSGAAQRMVTETEAIWETYKQVTNQFLANWVKILAQV